MGKIIFNYGQGGLGRPAPGKDNISGLLCFTAANLPVGYIPSTSATAALAVTTESTNNDTLLQLSVNGVFLLRSVVTFTGVSKLVDATLIVNGINANTRSSGFRATIGANGAFTIIGPASAGATLNTIASVITFGTDISVAIATNGAFAGGVTATGASIRKVFSWAQCQALGMSTSDPDVDLSLFAYAAQCFFMANPTGVLYLYPYKSAAAAHVFGNIVTLQNFANGDIRQMGLVSSLPFAQGDLTLIKAQRTLLVTAKRQCEMIYGADTSGVSDLSTLYDLSSLSDDGVSGVIGQDGGSLGASLAIANGVSYPAVGAFLGAASLAKVNECVGWVNKFDLSANTIGEFATVAFGNGVLVNDPSITQSLIDSLSGDSDNAGKRYVFLIYQDGVTGSFFNDSHCACPFTSDYAYVENNRTIGKAVRGINIAMTPNINAPLFVNSDGTLTDDTLALFKNTANTPVEQMVSNKEISSKTVTIDPTQNVESTGKIIVSVSLVPVGVARTIVVNIAFAVSVQA